MNPLSLAFATLWLSALLAVAGFAIVSLRPRIAPSHRYRLWYAVLLLSVGLPAGFGFASRPRLGAVLPVTNDVGSRVRQAGDAGGRAVNPPAAVAPPGEDGGRASRVRVALPAPWFELAKWIWLAGAVISLGGLAAEWGRLHRLRRGARPPPRSLLEPWAIAVAAMPTGRRLRLLVSDRLAVPLACGWRRPAVLVPLGLCQSLPAADVRHLFMHELAHLARRDDWHLVIQRLAVAVCWWNPVLRWVRLRLEADRELACDAAVASRVDHRDYARTLVRAAGLALDRRDALAPTALHGRLSTRVETLLGKSNLLPGWRPVSALAAGSLALAGAWLGPPPILVSAAAQAPSRTAPEPAEEVRTAASGAVGRVLDSVFRGFADSGFSGTVLVALGDAIVLERGYGLADRERGVPARADTRYSTAGITKLFTAAAILALEAEGKLSVTDPVSRWVGPLPGDKGSVTLHHLLTHTDGLTRLQAPVYRRSAGQFVEAMGSTPPAFAPGAGYRYNDFGHSLLGLVVERVSGESYEAFIRRRFLTPAGLARTGFEPEGEPVAVEYAGPAAALVPIGARAYTWGRRGSLGLVSTAGDLYRWIRAMRNPAILPEPVWGRMITARTGSDWGAEQGYGWDLQPRPTGRTLLRRVAGTPGFEGEILHDPVGGWTAVILVNSRLGWRFRVWQAIEAAVDSHGLVS